MNCKLEGKYDRCVLISDYLLIYHNDSLVSVS